MRHVPTLDATGMQALEALGKRCKAQGTTFILCEVRRELIRKLIRARKIDIFGRENFKGSLGTALERARKLLDGRT